MAVPNPRHACADHTASRLGVSRLPAHDVAVCKISQTAHGAAVAPRRFGHSAPSACGLSYGVEFKQIRTICSLFSRSRVHHTRKLAGPQTIVLYMPYMRRGFLYVSFMMRNRLTREIACSMRIRICEISLLYFSSAVSVPPGFFFMSSQASRTDNPCSRPGAPCQSTLVSCGAFPDWRMEVPENQSLSACTRNSRLRYLESAGFYAATGRPAPPVYWTLQACRWALPE